ncbi:MAG: DUF2892 domain-containing protein [Candidatus Moranbacteria bacterium]|nr:DUF2892 domain-containing protein [Candidatus Moranbacteria bacterium]
MKNESNFDRGLRVVLGAILFLVGTTMLTGTASIIAYALGFVLLVTAATGFCALYRLFGINTNKDNK